MSTSYLYYFSKGDILGTNRSYEDVGEHLGVGELQEWTR